MDYDSILKLADRKQEMNDTINGFSLKRKAHNSTRSSGPDRAVIEAFKARKEKEEMERMQRARREKERLLSLRAQSGKSMKKSKMMTYRTKDNDFSRIVLTAEQIEEQRRVEEKLKKKGITDVCERMKTRIDLEEEESGLPKKRQHRQTGKTVNSGVNNNDIYLQLKKREAEANKNKSLNKSQNKSQNKRVQQTPPISYQQLMSLAAEKANTEKPSLSDELIKEFEEKKNVRPMTQKEKDEQKEEKFYRERANKGLARLPTAAERKLSEKIAQNKAQLISKNSRTDIQRPSLEKQSTSSKAIPNKPNPNRRQSNAILPERSIEKQISLIRNKNNAPNNRNVTNESVKRDHMTANSSRSDISRPDKNLIYAKSNNDKLDNRKVCDRRTEQISQKTNSMNSTPKNINSNKFSNKVEFEKSIVPNSRGRPQPPQSQRQPQSQPSQRPPQSQLSQRPQQSQLSQRPPQSKLSQRLPQQQQQPQSKLPPIGSTYRRSMYEDVAQYVDDDYDEDEDDMSDFIDDGPEEPEEEDYSKAIREIFGYDKRKYRNVVEDDDDVEEANFAQCMREEKNSLRIGIQEDLEDMQKEEEEKRLKALKNKKLKK